MLREHREYFCTIKREHFETQEPVLIGLDASTLTQRSSQNLACTYRADVAELLQKSYRAVAALSSELLQLLQLLQL